jgi:Flp pilus assembly pilin Flp
MNTLIEALKAFWSEDEGLEMIEYAVLAALIVVVIAAAVPGLTAAVAATFAGIVATL